MRSPPAAPHAAPPPGFVDPGPAEEGALRLAQALGVPITVADVLVRRGRADDEETRRYLEPRLAHLTPPDTMADREVAAERLAAALRRGERIAVFGDYDCDGITSAAILTSALCAMGGNVVPLLASRFNGGYGLSSPALARVLQTEATLLVTCDCGSSDHERLARARDAGLEVIVIDHHLVPEEPLPALAFLNPHRPECRFPYKGLASCGLSLSLVAAVRQRLGAPLDLRAWLDLVAIGTVADVAPLTGDNRALVRAGLSVLRGGARPGLRALAELARLDLSRGASAEDIAFRLAPRLNAPGRLGGGEDALALLLSEDPAQARALAARIEQAQERRRALQEEILREAIFEIEERGWGDAPGIVVAREGWHPGIVGIAAGRIASRFRRPTIVIALEGERGRGSVRGPAGARLHDALLRCRSALVAFGGHQAAAGIEVLADAVAHLRALWLEACSGALRRPGDDPPAAEARLDPRDTPFEVATGLGALEPCGEGNPAPLLLVADATVRASREVKGHLKLELDYEGHPLGAFGFEMGGLARSLGRRVDLIGRLRPDAWRGGGAVELRIEHVGARA